MHKYLLQILKFPLISLSFLDLFAFSYALTVLFPLILIKLNFKHFSTVRFCSIFLFLAPFFSTWIKLHLKLHLKVTQSLAHSLL